MQKYAQDQVLVYGANTFRAFRKFVVEYDEPYYESLNALPKIVFSSTLQEPLGWSNSTVISEDAVTAMARLKRETDKPMRSHGSVALNRSLLAAGLVDFLEVTVSPRSPVGLATPRCSRTGRRSTSISSNRPCSMDAR